MNNSGQVTGTPPAEGPFSAIANPVTLGGQVLSGVVAIAAGGFHTVALKNDGSVLAWGGNYYGQTTVPVAAQSGVTAIAAGEGDTVALKNDGSVLAWGDNGFGQTNVPVAARSGVTAIAAGEGHIVALKNDGSVLAWGANYWGATTVPAAAQSGVAAIAAGGDCDDSCTGHTVALKHEGNVLAWGDNRSGQTTVPAAAQSGVMAIAAGGYHTVALLGTRVSMDVRRSDNDLILSWPSNATGFTLQSAFQLTPPVTWVDVANEPAVIGGQFTVTNAFSGSALFYRLRKQ